MLVTRGYAAKSATTPIEPYQFERREPGAHDVLIKIDYCGICHSDIHQARNEWQGSSYPMVPGHEIVGRIARIGSAVTKFKVDDLVGVGCFVDSCRSCSSCHEGLEQYCTGHIAFTYNGTEKGGKTPTQGGYSSQIVVDENYVLRVPKNLPLPNVAPLLCAGITTYSPLKHFKIGKGSKVAIVGLGGLGHMGVKLAAAMGAGVTIISTSASKEEDAKRLGAHHFLLSKDPKQLESYANHFDLILNTVAVQQDLSMYANLLHRDGTMVLVGLPEQPYAFHPAALIMQRRQIAGSVIGGIRETQEMLDFCAEKNTSSDIELIPVQKIEEAYTRTIKADVRYRFVIDLSTL